MARKMDDTRSFAASEFDRRPSRETSLVKMNALVSGYSIQLRAD
jgi:hypothetical protein